MKDHITCRPPGVIIVAVTMLCCMTAVFAADVTSLRCEYLENPLGIDAAKPRLAWKLETRNAKPERGVKQTAYQVLVASTPEHLAKDKGDLWDSGKVESDQSIQVEYQGKPLDSRRRCYWKVRVWSGKVEAGNLKFEKAAGSEWSQPAWWTMGLLSTEAPLSLGSAGAAGWQAKWITMKAAEGIAHPWLRRTFGLKSDVRRAEVYVNTPSEYELYVNGRKVGADVLAPAHVNVRRRFLYNAYDVSSFLHPGTNCIALWMGPGWYQPVYGNPYHAPIVRAQLAIDSADGRTVIGTDAQWRASHSCISQIGSWGWGDMGGERWDARRFVKDWNQAAFDDSAWPPAVEIPAPKVEHSWQAMPGSRLRSPIAPKRIYAGKGKWVVDFGTTLTGWMRLHLSALRPGQEVTIEYADLDDPRLEFQNNGDGFQTFNQKDIYVAGDEGSGIFCSKFNQHAFRYAVIAGLSQAPALSEAEAMTVETDLEAAGAFACSNELFNRIHQVTVATYHTQIPCGVLGGGEAREKLGYGDGGSFLSGMLFNLRSDAFFQKWLRDWCDGQRADGFLGHTAPEFYPAGGGPSWGGQASELVRRLYLYYGDRRAAAVAYDTLKKYLHHLESQTSRDILRYFNPYDPKVQQEWYFLGDWTPPGPSADKHGFVFETTEQREFFNNCYRVLLWDQLAMYADALGNRDEARQSRERLAVLRPLIHHTYYDSEKQTYKANQQAYLPLALCAQVTPPELRPAILKQLEEAIVTQAKGHLATGLQGTFLMLDLLNQENRNDLVALMMNQTTYPGWGFLLNERKVTTWPETWSGWGSQIIQVVGSPGAWFYEGLAGIRPDPQGPGFKQILIKPAIVGDLAWVKAHHDSPYGRIASHWRRDGTRLSLDIMIPANTTATVFVPAKDAAGVTESGQPANLAAGVKFLRQQANAAVFVVGSGTYRFQSTLPETET
jgi:alpha-L-rhamnosidase